MNKPRLKTISIADLKVGMYVHAIIEQKGTMLIKSQGKVSHENIIKHLRSKGVKRLTIDLDKQFVPVTSHESPQEVKTTKGAVVSLNGELKRALGLHQKGKKIQQRLQMAVEKGLPFDRQIPREFTQEMVGSINRNPDALLCLTKIREKDDYLLEHSLNVAILLANFAKFTGMSDKDVEDIAFSGFLHDIGKIKTPDKILHKPGRLTEKEMDIMKLHVQHGVETLVEMGIDNTCIRTVSEHHERLDGLGYPKGLKGEDISHNGRMLAIADMYDALTADRCYKAGMTAQKALKILLSETPSRIDKELIQQFIKCMGVYPVGSLVMLNNERIAVVLGKNEKSPLNPTVKVFYSVKGQHYLEPKDIDLASEANIKIVKAVIASDYKIDFNQFFTRAVLPN
jgi:putative nucleotidyltransferase with HDIG domain